MCYLNIRKIAPVQLLSGLTYTHTIIDTLQENTLTQAYKNTRTHTQCCAVDVG